LFSFEKAILMRNIKWLGDLDSNQD